MFRPFIMMLVKLGGSVITDKARYRTLRQEAINRLAEDIATSGEKAIIVHGAGSFGHVIAAEHQLQKGYTGEAQIPGMARVMEDVRALNLAVISALGEVGISSVSLPPSTVAELTDGKLTGLDLSLFHRYLDLGITPVTFGDVALDRTRRFGICSGDQLMESLAREFRPERIIFCADVDGVFTGDPKSDPEAKLIEVVDRRTLDSLPRTQSCADVTGSIFGKIETMLRITSYGGEAVVINGLRPGRLGAALRGEDVLGSKVVGGSQ